MRLNGNAHQNNGLVSLIIPASAETAVLAQEDSIAARNLATSLEGWCHTLVGYSG
jgi:hypothetical protein